MNRRTNGVIFARDTKNNAAGSSSWPGSPRSDRSKSKTDSSNDEGATTVNDHSLLGMTGTAGAAAVVSPRKKHKTPAGEAAGAGPKKKARVEGGVRTTNGGGYASDSLTTDSSDDDEDTAPVTFIKPSCTWGPPVHAVRLPVVSVGPVSNNYDIEYAIEEAIALVLSVLPYLHPNAVRAHCIDFISNSGGVHHDSSTIADEVINMVTRELH